MFHNVHQWWQIQMQVQLIVMSIIALENVKVDSNQCIQQKFSVRKKMIVQQIGPQNKVQQLWVVVKELNTKKLKLIVVQYID